MILVFYSELDHDTASPSEVLVFTSDKLLFWSPVFSLAITGKKKKKALFLQWQTKNRDVAFLSKVKFISSSLCEFPRDGPGCPSLPCTALLHGSSLFIPPALLSSDGSKRCFWQLQEVCCPAVSRDRMKIKRPSAFSSFGHFSDGKHRSLLVHRKRKAWELQWVGDAISASPGCWMCDHLPGHMAITSCSS